MSDRPTPECNRQQFHRDNGHAREHSIVVSADFARRLERQRDEAREILAATLKAMPVGYLPNHTPERIPERVADLVTRYAEAEHQRDEWMDRTTDALAQVGILTEQREEYAKTLRVIAESNDRSHHETAYSAFIRERHPELAGGRSNPATGMNTPKELKRIDDPEELIDPPSSPLCRVVAVAGSPYRVSARKTCRNPEEWAAFVWRNGAIVHVEQAEHVSCADAKAAARNWIKENDSVVTRREDASPSQ